MYLMVKSRLNNLLTCPCCQPPIFFSICPSHTFIPLLHSSLFTCPKPMDGVIWPFRRWCHSLLSFRVGPATCWPAKNIILHRCGFSYSWISVRSWFISSNNGQISCFDSCLTGVSLPLTPLTISPRQWWWRLSFIQPQRRTDPMITGLRLATFIS